MCQFLLTIEIERSRSIGRAKQASKH